MFRRSEFFEPGFASARITKGLAKRQTEKEDEMARTQQKSGGGNGGQQKKTKGDRKAGKSQTMRSKKKMAKTRLMGRDTNGQAYEIHASRDRQALQDLANNLRVTTWYEDMVGNRI